MWLQQRSASGAQWCPLSVKSQPVPTYGSQDHCGPLICLKQTSVLAVSWFYAALQSVHQKGDQPPSHRFDQRTLGWSSLESKRRARCMVTQDQGQRAEKLSKRVPLLNSLLAPTFWLPFFPSFLTGGSSYVNTSHTLSKWGLVGCFLRPEDQGVIFHSSQRKKALFSNSEDR
jgi:hypothetical protein